MGHTIDAFDDDGVYTRKCSRCDLALPESDFGHHPHGALLSDCRVCHAAIYEQAAHRAQPGGCVETNMLHVLESRYRSFRWRGPKPPKPRYYRGVRGPLVWGCVR